MGYFRRLTELERSVAILKIQEDNRILVRQQEAQASASKLIREQQEYVNRLMVEDKAKQEREKSAREAAQATVDAARAQRTLNERSLHGQGIAIDVSKSTFSRLVGQFDTAQKAADDKRAADEKALIDQEVNRRVKLEEKAIIADLLVLDPSLSRFVTNGRWDHAIEAAAAAVRTKSDVKRFTQTGRQPF